MSNDDSAYWRARAGEVRVRAEQMHDGISKHVMRRIADDYDRLAQMVEHRPNRFSVIPPAVPAEVRRFAPCRTAIGAPPGTMDLEVPGFLKRGPATAEELGASG